MARMSRLLGAVCLGVAATAAVATVAITREYAPVHRSPTGLAESTQSGRVIVKFKERTTIMSASTSAAHAGPQAAATLGSRLGLAMKDGRTLGSRSQVLTAQGMSSTALAALVAKDADVEWVQVDHRRFIQAAPNDPLYPNNLSTTVAPSGPAVGQWYLRAPDAAVEDASGTLVISSINIEPAWAITHGSASVVIGDVDTGITTHPELTGSVNPSSADSKVFPATFTGTTSATAYGYDFVGYTASDANGGGDPLGTANDGSLDDPDPSDPGDWVTATENSTKNGPFFGCNDDGTGAAVGANSSWHGTQTAGILGAATNNGIGMAGVGYNTMIVPARALGKCGGFDSDIIAAAEWAGGVQPAGSVGASGTTVPTNIHPARVINMSLGGSGVCATDAPAYVEGLTLLRNNHVVVVVAAGNDEGLAVDVPGNCKPDPSDSDQTPLVVTVAAVRHVGDKVGFSDVGPEVTLSAPGGNCVNTDANSACLYPILTTANTGTTSPVAGGATYTTSFGEPSLGTSFATPMVAGTVALMMSVAPNLSNSQIIGLLKSTARPFPTAGGTAGTPICTAPTKTTQDECYCTTSTCGAGMLDAGAAVTAANALAAETATITGGTSVTAGNALTLSGASSNGTQGAAITGYAWSITNGGAFATLGSTTGSSVVLTGVAAGTVDVQLTITDATGASATTTATITVNAASSSSGGTSSGGSTSSGGGGGGAANPAWLAALVVAGLLLTPRARRRRAS